jgi:DNA-binding response OmpR family regulator
MGTSLALTHKSESGAGRILVIDDDAELCKLVSRFLGAEGYFIETVQTSKSGIERALSGDYDLVVLDVMLPDIDGFEVLRRVRSKSNTPVLMLTARGDDPDRILGLEMGADDYLPKPFNTRELSARVRAILRRVPAEWRVPRRLSASTPSFRTIAYAAEPSHVGIGIHCARI